MKIARILIVTGLAATSWAALAKPAAAPASPTPAEIVAARQAGMAMSAATFTTIRTASAAGTPLKDLAFAAGGLAKWGAAMPALFHPSTRAITSRAKPEVWTDKAGFAARAAAAKAEDKDTFAAALASTGAACKGCHDSFQVPPPPAKPG